MQNKYRKYFFFVLLGFSVWFFIRAAAGGGELKAYFLDVGQGDSIFIVFPCGKNMLIDGGDPRQINTDLTGFLRRRGVRRIDAAVLTHAHADHAGGLLEVLEKFPAGMFIEPGYNHTTDLYLNLLELALRKDIAYQNVSRGDTLKGFGGVEITFFNPPRDFYADESPLNNNSIVIHMRYGDVKFLFTGDIERRAEADLVRIYGKSLSSHILKAPHHGSGSSSTPAFLKAVTPAVAVISAGEGNSFGHPHPSVVSRYLSAGAELYRTDIDGTVVVKTDGKKITVKTLR